MCQKTFLRCTFIFEYIFYYDYKENIYLFTNGNYFLEEYVRNIKVMIKY